MVGSGCVFLSSKKKNNSGKEALNCPSTHSPRPPPDCNKVKLQKYWTARLQQDCKLGLELAGWMGV